MAFYNNYNGDMSSLKLIQDNIEKKTMLIPGISCQSGVDVSSLGDRCYYFQRSTSGLTTGKAGAPINYSAVGVVRKDFALEDAIKIGDMIPVVNPLSSVNIVEDRLVYQITEANNLHNELAINYLAHNGTDYQDYTALTKDNAYDTLNEVMRNFVLNNKDKGLYPTAVFVSNECAKFLLQDARFIRFGTNLEDYRAYNNLIGKIGKAYVFEAADLDTLTIYDFIVLSSEAFVAPLNVESVVVKDGAQYGYPTGKIIAGEIRYGFSIAEPGAVLVKKNAEN